MEPFAGLAVEVQSTHVDIFGHLNHARYLEFMEWARFAWASHRGLALDRIAREEHIGPAVLRVNIQYRRECRLGDKLWITVEPQSRRRAIGILRQRILVGGELAAKAEIAFVMLDLETRTAVALPEVFLEMLPGG